MKSGLLKMAAFIFIIGIFPACDPSDRPNESDSCNPDFDFEAMFEHIADHHILTGYQDLSTKSNDLRDRVNDFTTDATANALEQVRQDYVQAYLAWQRVAQFEFGPAADVFLRNSVNNFPLNEQELLENVQTGVYDFGMPDRYDKGFPALDFLLYGAADSDAELINLYRLGANAAKYQDYLKAVVADIDDRCSTTLESWETSYRTAFLKNTGTAAGTSLSLVINGFNEHYELLKREKLGIPSGVLTLGIPNPDRVEAKHSGLSAALLKSALQAAANLFNGQGLNGVNGLGLSELIAATNAEKNDIFLADVIANQFAKASEAAGQLNLPLDQLIPSQNELVINAYNEVTRQVVNIKTDLPSVLCVSITYIDNPSDSD